MKRRLSLHPAPAKQDIPRFKHAVLLPHWANQKSEDLAVDSPKKGVKMAIQTIQTFMNAEIQSDPIILASAAD
jgi:hypothetical protein